MQRNGCDAGTAPSTRTPAAPDRSTDRDGADVPPPTAPEVRSASVHGRSRPIQDPSFPQETETAGHRRYPSAAAAFDPPRRASTPGSDHQSQQGEQRHVLDQAGRDR